MILSDEEIKATHWKPLPKPPAMAQTCSMEALHVADEAMSTPFTHTALSAMIAKASEVMQQRAISAGSAINPIYGAGAAIDAIRALPNVTLEELL